MITHGNSGVFRGTKGDSEVLRSCQRYLGVFRGTWGTYDSCGVLRGT